MVSQVVTKHRALPERGEFFCAVGFELVEALLRALEPLTVFFAFAQKTKAV